MNVAAINWVKVNRGEYRSECGRYRITNEGHYYQPWDGNHALFTARRLRDARAIVERDRITERLWSQALSVPSDN